MPERSDGTEPSARIALLIGLVPILGVAALVLGPRARRRASKDLRPGEGLALVATFLGTGWLFVVMFIGITTGVVHPSRDAAGSVTGPQQVGFDDLHAGDCLLSPVQPTQRLKGYDLTVEVVPCRASHYGEVVLWLPHFRIAHPGLDSSAEVFQSRCRRAVSAYADPTRSIDTGYLYVTPELVIAAPPSARGLLCFATSEDGSSLQGSIARAKAPATS